jgi:cytochrome c553
VSQAARKRDKEIQRRQRLARTSVRRGAQRTQRQEWNSISSTKPARAASERIAVLTSPGTKSTEECMNRCVTAAGALLAGTFAITAFPQDTRGLAAGCSGCHGTDGMAMANSPTLAGRSRDELARLLRDFKSGARPGTVMPQLAKGYSDAEIDALAAWFASQKASR